MSGPRGGVIDWTDPEQVRAYHREYVRDWAQRSGYNERRKEARRNRPAGDGGKKKGRRTEGFYDAAYCTENVYAEEISWGIDKEKLRRNVEE